MLRKQLIARLGVLVVGFVGGAILAILLLHAVLGELNVAVERATTAFDNVRALDVQIDRAEAALIDDPDASVSEQVLAMIAAHDRLREHPAMHEAGPGAETLARIGLHLQRLSDEGRAPPDTPMHDELHTLRADVHALSEVTAQTAAADQIAVSRDLRLLIVALSIAALVMANVAVLVLLRTGQLILRPVSALVEGSRLLAAEHFHHRVKVDRNDEFGELARAYNHLAEELETNEQRRIETLRQLAVTLNHEINNVLNVIELQLGILDRRAAGDSALAAHLLHIREALHRIARTVASLRDLRRIVVTDYAPGQKMLDLARSTESTPTEAALTAGNQPDER